MMKTAKTKLSRWKMATLAPLLAGLFVFIACQEQLISDITKSGSTITQTDFPPEVAKDINVYKETNPSGKDNGTITYITGDTDDIKKLTSSIYAGQVIIKTYTFDESGTMGVLLHHVGQYAGQLTTRNADGEEIFTIVEESASPVGGMPEFFKYVSSKIKYPLTARQNNINGQVFIEFIVNEDGHISNVVALKGIGGGCDEEAIQVVQNSPLWNPAKQRGKMVKQRMVLPITFNFNSQHTAFIALDELKGSDDEFEVALSSEKSGSKIKLSGTVRDVNGKSIEGMNILVRNTSTGTVTMPDGKFQLEIESTSGELVFSFVGYKTKSVAF